MLPGAAAVAAPPLGPGPANAAVAVPEPWRGRRAGYVTCALGVLPLSSPVRRGLITLAESRAFRGLSMVAIIAYAAILGASKPAAPPSDPANRAVDVSNYAFTAWFTLELLVKVLAFGLVLMDGETVRGALAAALGGARALVTELSAAGRAADAGAEMSVRGGGGGGGGGDSTTASQAGSRRGMGTFPGRNGHVAQLGASTQPPAHAALPPAGWDAGEEAGAAGKDVEAPAPALLRASGCALAARPQAARGLDDEAVTAARRAGRAVGSLWEHGGGGGGAYSVGQGDALRKDAGAPPPAPPSEGTPAALQDAPRPASVGAAAGFKPDVAGSSVAAAAEARTRGSELVPNGSRGGAGTSRPGSSGGGGGGGGSRAAAAAAAAGVQPPFLREPWNAFDFAVVVLSLASLAQGAGPGASSLRAFRLLLPLRAISNLPSLKTAISALLAAVPALTTIGAGILFIVVLWGVLGMQLFQDAMHNNCVNADPKSWASGATCTLFDGPWAGAQCPAGEKCAPGGTAPEAGQLSFDNFGAAVIPIYMTMADTSWSRALRPTMNATAGWAFFYYVTLLVVGYVIVLALVLATLVGAFMERHKQERIESAAAGTPEQSALGRWFSVAWHHAVEAYWAPLPGALGRLAGARWWRWLSAVVDHWAFELVVILAVVTNTVLLSMQYAGMSDAYAAALDKANNVLSFVFMAEALIKIGAQGRAYFTSVFNCFDFAVSGLCVMSVFVEGASGVGALRAIRVLRVLRLLTVLPNLQRCVIILGRVVAAAAPFLLLVFFVYYIFALLGMQLFGGACTSPEDPLLPTFGFGSLWEALLAVFTLSLGDVGDMFAAMSCSTGAAAVYYIAATICGRLILVNLLIGLMYSVFCEEQQRLAVDGRSKSFLLTRLRSLSSARLRSLGLKPADASGSSRHWLRRAGRQEAADAAQDAGSVKPFPPPATAAAGHVAGASDVGGQGLRPQPPEVALEVNDAGAGKSASPPAQPEPLAAAAAASEAKAAPPGPLRRTAHSLRAVFCDHARWKGAMRAPLSEFENKSFFVFGPQSRLRRWAFSVVDDARFDAFVFAVILANCVVMAAENPGNSRRTADVLFAFEAAFLAVYVAEMLLKMTALGAIGGRRAYFRNPWNWLDFVIVLTSIVGEVVASIGWVSVLRVLRALRALRLLNKVPEVKAVVTCLGTSVVKTGNMLVVVAVLMIIFSIVGMELFLGKLSGCVSVATSQLTSTCCADPADPATCLAVVSRDQCVGFAPPPSPGAEPSQCHWARLPFNFDNIGESMVTLSILITASSFSSATPRGMSAVGPGMQPVAGAQPAAALFYVLYAVVGFVFLLNFLVCIIMDAYASEAREHGPGLLLTDRQRAWVDAQRLLLRTPVAASGARVRALPPVRRALARLTGSAVFRGGVMACVVLNTLMMMTQHYSQSPAWDNALQWGSTTFTILFCVESLLKLGAQGVRGYFHDPWNVLDFLVSWGSVPSIFITAGPAANVLRTLRIARVLTLLRRVPSVRRLMVTLYLSAPTIGNMLLLILLMIYTFAVLGVNLFYGIQDPNFDKFLNWGNVGSAMMMLAIVASGDWDGFMRSTGVAPPFCDASVPRACSISPALAQAFFIGFTLLMYVVLLNIVLGVVVEAMAMSKGPPDVPPAALARFQRQWARLDPLGRGAVGTEQLALLLATLDPPLGVRGTGVAADDLVASLPGLEVDEAGLAYYHQARHKGPCGLGVQGLWTRVQVLQVLTARAAGINLDELSPEVLQKLKSRTDALRGQDQGWR